MDIFSQEKRSEIMSRIKSGETKPERAVRSLLHRKGYRFRLHVRTLPGSPDVVLPKYRTAIFIHGCFWHRHSGCRYAYMPKTRPDFWLRKFDQNRTRDQRTVDALRALHWNVLVVWECELKDMVGLTIRLESALRISNAGKSTEC